MAVCCINCKNGAAVSDGGLCIVCAAYETLGDDKTLIMLQRCGKVENLVESLRRIKGQLESTARQADRAAREIEEFLDT